MGLDVAVVPFEGPIDTLVVVGCRGARRLASDPGVLAQVSGLARRAYLRWLGEPPQALRRRARSPS